MGDAHSGITDELNTFIENQKIFFVATAMGDGHINLSPKGMNSFKVMGPNRVLWLNLTGSGNETATHILHDGRMTIMFCAFEGKPLILRLYGTAKAYHDTDKEWTEYIDLFPNYSGSRQIIDVELDLVKTSCGYGIPFMDFVKERETLDKWSVKKGEDGIKAYQKEKNSVSLDGHSTGLPGSD